MTKLVFDSYVLDPRTGRLSAPHADLELRPKTFEVLHYFAKHSGRLVTKEEIRAEVWPNVVVTDDSLVQCVREIRRALQDDEQVIVRTVPRRGYVFTRRVTEVTDDLPMNSLGPTLPATTSAQLPARGMMNNPKNNGWGLPALFRYLNRLVRRFRPDRRRTDTDPLFSIVVLPIKDSGASKRGGFADKLTSDLTLRILQLPGSFVIANNIADKYKSATVHPKQLREELRVGYALQGNMAQSNDRVQLTLDLVDTQTGQQLWAERFDGPPNALVLERIVRSLHLKIFDIESDRRRRLRPDAPTVDDLIVRGFSLIERQTRETVREARELAVQTTKLHPRAVNSWSVLAYTYFVDIANRWYPLYGSQEDWTRRGRDAAAMAYALDPNDFYAIGAWAWALETEGKFEEAAAAVHRQIAMTPSYTIAFHRLAYIKMLMGEPEEAVALEEQVLRIAPTHDIIHNAYSIMAACLIHLGRDAEAVAAAQKSAEARPVYPNPYAHLAAAAANLGDIDRAKAALATFKRLLPNYTIRCFRAEQLSDRPRYLVQRERYYEGLCRAGLEE